MFSYCWKSTWHTMSGGVQLEIQVSDAPNCPLLELPSEVSGRVVSKSVRPDREVVREVLEIEGEGASQLSVETEELFSKDDGEILLYERPACQQCPCECIEAFGSPIADAATNDGCLALRFYLTDVGAIREVVDSLKADFDGVTVNHLIHTESDDAASRQDIGYVDRGQLTNRQQEALDTAHRMGYFEYPRGANASEVASRMDIDRSTFVEHISHAQRKLLGDLL